VITFFIAGHDTLALTLSWTLYLLANNQEWQDRLLAEVQQVCGSGPLKSEHIAKLNDHNLVIKEAMRLFPPVYTQERVARENMTFSDGTSVERGDTVFIATYALHRHEKLWRNPNKFDPEQHKPENTGDHHRFQYIPFGGGPRICIGMGLAMTEATAILASIIRINKVAPIDGLAPYPKSRILLWPEGGINLTVTPRS
jgi:cytochrome P450